MLPADAIVRRAAPPPVFIEARVFIFNCCSHRHVSTAFRVDVDRYLHIGIAVTAGGLQTLFVWCFGYLVEGGAVLDGVRGADELGVTMVSIKVFPCAPSQRTGRILECVACYGDPEVGCVER